MTPEKTNPAEETFDASQLRDPTLAALLAWLLPGLGHFYQGRWAKGVLFFVCIMSTFVYGLYLGSDSKKGGCGRVVYASWDRDDKHPWFFAQIGIGLPAMPALVQAIRVQSGKEPFGTFMAPPKGATLDDLHRRLARYFQLGEVYTSIAGLLNILVILDAWAGPVLAAKREEDEDDGEGAAQGDKDAAGDSPERAATDDHPSTRKDSR